MARYLVTGGAGFIGSHLVGRLVEMGESVVVLDNLSTGKAANLAPWLDSIAFLQADIRDLDAVRQACAGVDYLLHQAALPSVPRSVRDPVASNETNVNGTLNVLVAARDAGVRRLVYAASSSAYGDTPTLPKHEAMPARPLSPYAVSKHAGELYCRVFSGVYGLETVALRYFNVFGPRQDPGSHYAAVIPKFITALQQGERPVIFGDGEQSRDFTYVGNVVDANLLACRAEGTAGEVINIACGARTSLNDLVRVLERITGAAVEPIYEKARPGDVKHSLADITKAQRLLGYRPSISLEEGLARTAAYYASAPAAVEPSAKQ
ncbi:MAG: SDR family oxidoreductase [Armatimonadota bacterium]